MSSDSLRLTQYTICLGALLSNLSAGMFNIALVDIADSLQVSLPSAQWVVTVYLLVISVLLPLMGKLGDRIGRTKVHNAGYFIFLAGALGCALSPSLPLLIASRVVQGAGAAMYQATNMALIISVFPKDQRGRALGLISTFVAAGSLAGPGLGGLVLEWFSWRTGFWLLTALALTAWLLANRLIPKDAPSGAGKPDLAGAALFAVSLTVLVTSLSLGGSYGWVSWQVLAPIIASLAGFLLFTARCLTPRPGNREPFIQLRLFREPGIAAGIGVTLVTYLAAFSAQLLLPVFFRSELELGPAAAGMIMMGYPLSLVIFSPLFGSLSDKLGTYPLMSAGLLLMAGAAGAMSFLSASYPVLAVLALIVLLGGSMGMITSPNNSLILGRARKSELGLVSSLIALSRNLGMMLGTAAGGAALGFRDQALGFRSLFLLCAVLLLLTFAVFALSFRSSRSKEFREIEG
ncbi:MFS transporter [Paenibacillus sp. JSM ZJ436]|uniref:MFS transporter n=1 Tax=Paenibacillus sp. JSM ZJ436 TaxID=3376190 RepID=UPI003791906A